MFSDFKELLSAFQAQNVKYLVIGGYAVSFHAQPRATKDLDVLIKADADNARAVHAALTAFGAPLEHIEPDDLIERGSFFRMGTPPTMVDIFPNVQGVDFDQAWAHRVEGTIDADSGQTAYFISSADLIAMKLAAGRPQDLGDVAVLREAEQERQAQEQEQRHKP